MQPLHFNLTSLGSGPPHHPAAPGIRCKCNEDAILRLAIASIRVAHGHVASVRMEGFQVSSAKQQLTQAIATNEWIGGSI